MKFAIILAFCFFISFTATPLVKKLAFKIGAVDKPNKRKVHKKLTARLGGLAMYFSFTLMVLLTQELTTQILGLLLGGTIIVVLGIFDDILDISPRQKLAGQILAAIVLVLFNIDVDFITHPLGGIIPLSYLSIPITIFWVVGITNAVNLIDGLDGLAAGVSCIAALIMAFVGYMTGQTMMLVLALMLAASILGFLPHNFYPATIFMGDSGSMFLGFNLSALAIMGMAKSVTMISVFVPILILGIPIFDTLFAIIRRFLNNKPIFKADKEHLHHCLLNMGLSHKETVLAIYGINIFLGGIGILVIYLTTAQAVFALAVVSLIILRGAQEIGITGCAPKRETVAQKTISK